MGYSYIVFDEGNSRWRVIDIYSNADRAYTAIKYYKTLGPKYNWSNDSAWLKAHQP